MVLTPGRRIATFGETIAAVRRVWTDEEAGFDSKYVSFKPSWSFPKPAQRPHPPMLLGCDPASLRLTFIDSAGFWKDASVEPMLDAVAELVDIAA